LLGIRLLRDGVLVTNTAGSGWLLRAVAGRFLVVAVPVEGLFVVERVVAALVGRNEVVDFDQVPFPEEESAACAFALLPLHEPPEGGPKVATPKTVLARATRRRLPRETLVFDTETANEPAMRLNVGAWRLYRDRPGVTAPTICVEEGLFHADDLPLRDPAGFARLRRYAAAHPADTSPGFPTKLELMPASHWLETRLFHYGYRHRDRCTIVGFNPTFDFGRFSQHVAKA